MFFLFFVFLRYFFAFSFLPRSQFLIVQCLTFRFEIKHILPACLCRGLSGSNSASDCTMDFLGRLLRLRYQILHNAWSDTKCGSIALCVSVH